MRLISAACFFTNLFELVLFQFIYLRPSFTFLENFDSRFTLMKHCFGLFRLGSSFQF